MSDRKRRFEKAIEGSREVFDEDDYNGFRSRSFLHITIVLEGVGQIQVLLIDSRHDDLMYVLLGRRSTADSGAKFLQVYLVLFLRIVSSALPLCVNSSYYCVGLPH